MAMCVAGNIFTERNILQSPFTDQSHAVFYRSANALPSTQLRVSSFRPQKLLILTSASDMADGTCSARTLPSTKHTSLKKELAELKLLVKQKEKELKAAKKEEKKKMKVGLKERKKVVKDSKDCESCDSSSSSESRGDRCEFLGAGNLDEKEVSGKVMLKGQLESVKSSVASFTCPLRADESPNRIEVYVGGKCKKAGSDLLLQELRSHVTNGCNLEAVPYKCKGKCSMAINMKVYREGANPQQHSHVGVDDAKFILASHFGFAPSPSARPSLPVTSGLDVAVKEHVSSD
ncbi:hypothetical protein KP509_1Z222800 [Ceratopteris richardii]|nr:hypothetical protein KP509_1Z222800 [Ceratopteris richardii]